MTIRPLPILAARFQAEHLHHDLRRGAIHHSSGDRHVYLPADLLRALYASLRYEAADAWSLILHRCGVEWGSRSADRLWAEAERSGQCGPGDLSVVDYLLWLREWFRYSGWGDVTFDVRDAETCGVVWVSLHFSLFQEILKAAPTRADPLLAGLLQAFFSRVSGHDLGAVEMPEGEDVMFVITSKERIESANEAIEDGATRAQLRAWLLNPQGATRTGP